MTGEPDETDEAFSAWMLDNLAHAAKQFGLTVTGEPIFGWNLRSVSARAASPTGPRWLRVGAELEKHTAEPFWTGIPDAAVIMGVPKPEPLDSMEWVSDAWPETSAQRRAVRADVMTVLEGTPCSPSEILQSPFDASASWWADLRDAIDRISATPTSRFQRTGPVVDDRIREVFGVSIAQRMPITRWETKHGDLHWNNLLAPNLGILDWEMWGRGPAGIDAAALYLRSLLVPDVASRVHEVFADILDSQDGWTAQAYAAARIVSRGEFPQLEGPLRKHFSVLLDEPA